MAIGNKRWKAGLMVVAIFVIGFFTGALTMNLVSTASEKMPSSWRGHGDSGRLVEQLAEQLHLTPEQRQAVSQILAETKEEYARLRREIRPRYRAIRNRSRERIRAILNPEQQKAFDALIHRHDEEKSRWRDHRH